MLDWLFSVADFVTRNNCGRWTPTLIYTYCIAQTLIAAAYLLIPAMLYWNWRYSRLRFDRRQWQVACFAAFILSCGFGHLLDGPMMFLFPAYRLVTVWHFFTATLSLVTLFLMPSFTRDLFKAAGR